MHSAAAVANERSFEVNAQRPGAGAVAFFAFNGIGQMGECRHDLFYGRGHGGWKIRTHAMPCQQMFETGESAVLKIRYVVPCPAMNVHVDESRNENSVRKIDHAC